MHSSEWPTPSKHPVNFDLWVIALVLCAVPVRAAQRPAPTTDDIALAGREDTAAQGKISAADPGGGALTYTLKARARHGEAAVDSATGAFTYVPAKDFSGADAFTVEVSNGKRKATAAVKLELAAVNDPPVAKALSLTTLEDTAARAKVSATDVDGDALTYVLRLGAQHGEAAVDARTGAVTYQPAADYTGADAFTVEVSDGRETAVSQVSVVVTAVNDAPIAEAATFKVDEDTRLDGQPIAHDVDGDALAFRAAKPPRHGALELSAQTGAFTFMPEKNFHGDDGFLLEVSDGKRKATAAILIQVAAVNDAPVVKGVLLTTNEDVPVAGGVIASDVDGDALSYKVAAAPKHGAVTVDAKTGRLSYAPAADYNGVDGFSIEVGDGTVSTIAEVSAVIAAVNDAPRVLATPFSLDEDSLLQGKATATDVDGDALGYRVVRKPAHGSFELSAQTGAFTYQPAHDYNGPDGFTLEVSDGKLKSEASISLDVRAVNDAPVARPLALSTREDTAVKGAVVASDVDDVALTYAVLEKPAHGEARVDARTGAVSYVPGADYNGVDAFSVEVKDSSARATAQISVAIAAVPDVPRVHAAVLPTPEDVPADGTLPGSDPDGDHLTFHLLSQPRLGAVVLTDAATGAYRFTPGADLNGEDAFAFDVSDGTTTVQGTVKLQVDPVNDAPTLANLDLATIEDQAVEGTLEGRDIDGDRLTYTVASQPKRGRASILGAQGVRFEPARDQNGPATFTVTVSDGKATSAPAQISVRIDAQNDAPVALESRLTTDEDTQLVGAMKASDVDGDPVAFAIVRPPAHGTVSVTDTASGLFVYSPAPNYFGEDDFAFSATDASKALSVANIRLSVAPVDDVPIADASGISAPFRGTVTGRLHGFDRESKSVTYRIVEQPRNGRVKLLNARTGDFEFSTDGTTSTSTGFRFEVSDGALTSAPAELVVQIRSL